MLKQAVIVLLAVCCCFSVIPLSHVEVSSIYWPQGAMMSIPLLIAVLGYGAYDALKLYGNKEYRLAKYFILSLVLSVVVSFIIIGAVWPYTMPPIVA